MNQERGTIAFNTATVERKVVYRLEKGKRYELEIKFSNQRSLPPNVRLFSLGLWSGARLIERRRCIARDLGRDRERLGLVLRPSWSLITPSSKLLLSLASRTSRSLSSG